MCASASMRVRGQAAGALALARGLTELTLSESPTFIPRYMWADVLVADGFEAFAEAGGPFDAMMAARLRECIYASGNTIEPGEAFRRFRGRDPVIEPLLKKKGLLEV